MMKIALSALAATMLCGAAHAAEAETVSVIVPYGDLDLASDTGRATLDERIDSAVKQVCTRPASTRDFRAVDAWVECRKQAAASAAEQLGAADMATETFALLY